MYFCSKKSYIIESLFLSIANNDSVCSFNHGELYCFDVYCSVNLLLPNATLNFKYIRSVVVGTLKSSWLGFFSLGERHTFGPNRCRLRANSKKDPKMSVYLFYKFKFQQNIEIPLFKKLLSV